MGRKKKKKRWYLGGVVVVVVGVFLSTLNLGLGFAKCWDNLWGTDLAVKEHKGFDMTEFGFRSEREITKGAKSNG